MIFSYTKCTKHPDRTALSFCKSCNEYGCDKCLTVYDQYYYCTKPRCQAIGQKVSKNITHLEEYSYSLFFCSDCMSITKIGSPGIVMDYPIIGNRLGGIKNICPKCNSVERKLWFCILLIPIFSIGVFKYSRVAGLLEMHVRKVK